MKVNIVRGFIIKVRDMKLETVVQKTSIQLYHYIERKK